MRRAMAEAEVGDDVFGDDPTVRALEERAAELLGKEAGVFVTSGTQGNLVAQMAHLARGQEAIVGVQSDVVLDEAAGHRRRAPVERGGGARGDRQGTSGPGGLRDVLPVQGPRLSGRERGGGRRGLHLEGTTSAQASRRRAPAGRGGWGGRAG